MISVIFTIKLLTELFLPKPGQSHFFLKIPHPEIDTEITKNKRRRIDFFFIKAKIRMFVPYTGIKRRQHVNICIFITK